MKNFIRVVLPIAAIVGLVFLVTYMSNYSPTDSSRKGDGNKTNTQLQALKFPYLVAQASADWKFRHWNSDYEVGDKEGRFDFWFRNENDQLVRFASNGVSFQCTGAYVAVISQEAMNDYLAGPGRAAAHLPGMPGSPVLDALNFLKLQDHIHFKHVAGNGQKGEVSIPGAPSRTSPQFAIVRLTWEAKPQGEDHSIDAPVTIAGFFLSQLPNAIGAAVELKATYSVVQPFQVTTGGEKPHEFRLGDLLPGTSITRELICWSKTRSDLLPTLELATAGTHADCVTWTPAEPLNRDEIAQLEKKFHVADQPPLRIRSAARIFVTVYERRFVDVDGRKVSKKLDLGPLNFQINVSAGGSKPVVVGVSAIVRGAVRITSGSNSVDSIDFGRSFSSNESKTKSINIISEAAGLDLEEAERNPKYLETTLTPNGEKDRRKSWILQVTIPEKTLFGDLPPGSSVILQTKDSPPRRIRIPIKAKTLD